MDVEMIDSGDREARFVLNDATPQLANALRRAMISKVPTMAIDEIEFTNNTSGLFDEVLAHRLGMIPWEFDADHYKLPEEGKEDDPQRQVRMVLTKEGEGTVYANDLKPTDKQVTPAYPDILLLNLLEDQEVDLEAKAILGKGTEHAKFQAARATYRYYPIVTINGDEVENNEEAANVAPDAVKNADGPVEADSNIVYAMEETVDISEGDEIELEEDDTRFLFTVESVSGHDVEYIMKKAADIVIDELDEFREDADAAINDL